jgi:hypothetical protein
MKMKDSENFNSAHCDIAHRPSEREGASDGERDYVEHVRAQKLSILERFVVLGALVLLGVAGMTAHLGASMPSAVDPIATASVSGQTPHRVSDYCREYSPYAERAC